MNPIRQKQIANLVEDLASKQPLNLNLTGISNIVGSGLLRSVNNVWTLDTTNYLTSSHVVNNITQSDISNWNTAFNQSHTHANKSILDATSASFTTALKDKLDNLFNYTLPIASGTVLGGIKVGTNLSIDANGVLSSVNTTYTNGTLAQLTAGTDTTTRLQSAKNLNDWLDSKNYVTAAIITGLATETWVETNYIPKTHVVNAITSTNITNWNSAFGWGNHASVGYLTTATLPNPSLVSSTSATGTTNVATTNTNTYLNIVFNGGSIGSSSQITGSGSVTVTSDASGKITIAGTNTTYTAGTLTVLNTGTATTQSTWTAAILNDWLTGKDYATVTQLGNYMPITHAANVITATNITNWNTAFTNNHTHSNKSVLDGITSALVTKWNTAHTYSQVGHLPTVGGTMTGNITLVNTWNQPALIKDISTTTNSGYGYAFFKGKNSNAEVGLGISNNGDLVFGNWSSVTDLSSTWNKIWHSGNLTNLNQLTNGPGYLTTSTLPNPSLVSSTSATGTTNVATTNTNTYLNIVFNGGSIGSSSQITGSGSVTVTSDASGKITIAGTNTTYTTETLANLNTGTSTTGLLQSAKNLNDWLAAKNYVTSTIINGLASEAWVTGNFISNTHVVNNITQADIDRWVEAWGWGNHASAGYSLNTHTHTFASLTSKPTTLSGYGITDAGISGVVASSATGTADSTSTTNGNTYINRLQGGVIKESVRLIGAGATTVTHATGGVITITSTNTTYGVETLANLNTGTSTTGLLQSAKNLNDWLAAKNYATTSQTTRIRGNTTGSYTYGDVTILPGNGATVTQDGKNITVGINPTAIPVLKSQEFVIVASNIVSGVVTLNVTDSIYNNSLMLFLNGVKIPRTKIVLNGQQIKITNSTLYTPIIIDDVIEIEFLSN